MVVVPGIKIPLDSPAELAVELAVRRLRLHPSQVDVSCVIKSSIDARRRDAICLVYSIGLKLKGGEVSEERAVKEAGDPQISLRRTDGSALECSYGSRRLKYRPVVVGFGPAGIFAALVLARNGYHPLVLERGAAVEERVRIVEHFWTSGRLDSRTNVQYGEGGAGTFSDGKLTTRIHDPRCDFVLAELASHGAPEEILYKSKPHIGTDRLRQVVASLRQEILRLGGEIRFLTCMEELEGDRQGVHSLHVAFQGGREEIPASAVILAVGHSARDSFQMLQRRQLEMEPKAFSVGVRIEQLQSEIDKGLFGSLAGHPALGRGEYQLSLRRGDRGVYTFCMCPGGMVVPSSSEERGVVTNGMSEFRRDRPNANAALVVSVDSRDFGSDALDGVRFQRTLEQAAYEAGGGGYQAPAQDVASFLRGERGLNLGRVEPSYPLGVVPWDFGRLFPPAVDRMLREGLAVFERRLHGFGSSDAVLTGVETRTSSPVRILRGASLQSEQMPGLYPCGEGAGYAGGIVSAAVDGIRCAQAIMAEYAPLE